MRSEALDFITSLGTLWQIVLGAGLATGGGLLANQLEWRVLMSRRERNAALLFGEILSGFAIIMARAHETKQVGEPFGPVTVRVLRQARRELEIYERNRESIVDLRDAALRARIYALVHRLAMPLDGLFDATQEIAVLETQLRSRSLDPEDRSEMETRVADLKERRDAVYDFIRGKTTDIDEVLGALAPLAGHAFAREEART